jgi:hypothetical protein
VQQQIGGTPIEVFDDEDELYFQDVMRALGEAAKIAAANVPAAIVTTSTGAASSSALVLQDNTGKVIFDTGSREEGRKEASPEDRRAGAKAGAEVPRPEEAGAVSQESQRTEDKIPEPGEAGAGEEEEYDPEEEPAWAKWSYDRWVELEERYKGKRCMRCNCYIEPGDDENNRATATDCSSCKETFHRYCTATCRTCSETFCLFCFALMKHTCMVQPRGSIFDIKKSCRRKFSSGDKWSHAKTSTRAM